MIYNNATIFVRLITLIQLHDMASHFNVKMSMLSQWHISHGSYDNTHAAM